MGKYVRNSFRNRQLIDQGGNGGSSADVEALKTEVEALKDLTDSQQDDIEKNTASRDFSKGEKVIGFIDSKPVYRRVMNVAGPFAATTAAQQITILNGATKILSIRGTWQFANPYGATDRNNYIYPLGDTGDADISPVYVYIEKDAKGSVLNSLWLRIGKHTSEDYNIKNIFIIVEYLK